MKKDVLEQEISKNLKIPIPFVNYLMKKQNITQNYETNLKLITKVYESKKTAIQNLTKIFQKYQIDGNIIYINDKQDTFTKLMQDSGMVNDTVVQLYWTYKCRATKDLLFTLNEFILGMLKLKCKNIGELKSKVTALKQRVIEKNKYKQLYQFYFTVFSNGSKLIQFQNAIDLWEHLLKDQFKEEIFNFTAFCKSRQKDLQSLNKVSFDLWCQVWKFLETVGTDYSKFQEEDAWPVVIYLYVESKQKLQSEK